MNLVNVSEKESEIARATGSGVELVITRHFIYKKDMGKSSENMVIIPISKIDSISAEKNQKYWALIFSVVLLVGALYFFTQQQQDVAGVEILISVLFGAYWWFTRKTGVTIHSVSGKTEISLNGFGGNQKHVESVINNVRKAIIESYN